MGNRLTQEEEPQVVARARAGDPQARARLVEANMGMLVGMARQYRSGSLEPGDLVGEGVRGLFHALECWEEGRGVRFGTYAHYWVRQCMARAREKTAYTVRMPTHAADQWGRVLRAKEALAQEGDEEPGAQEVAARAGISEAQLGKLENAAHVASLDDYVGEERDRLGELLGDGKPDFVEPLVARLALRQAMQGMPPKLREAIVLRFGLDGEGERSFREMGTLIGTSGEGAAQRTYRGLAWLRERFLA
jgi:RNA polymerase primary sigma factor